MIYIGSCRYMYLHDWDYFPARLYTTREIIYFLQNIHNINDSVSNVPGILINYVFGDMFNPGAFIHQEQMSLESLSRKFIEKNKDNFTDYTDVILEISSLKLYYYKDIPLNAFYVDFINKYVNIIDDFHITSKELTHSEVIDDLIIIKDLVRKIFNNAKITIIPHLNLKSVRTNGYIKNRENLTNMLSIITNELKISFFNVGEYLENLNPGIFLETCMPDSYHYIERYEKQISEYFVEHFGPKNITICSYNEGFK